MSGKQTVALVKKKNCILTILVDGTMRELTYIGNNCLFRLWNVNKVRAYKTMLGEFTLHIRDIQKCRYWHKFLESDWSSG